MLQEVLSKGNHKTARTRRGAVLRCLGLLLLLLLLLCSLSLSCRPVPLTPSNLIVHTTPAGGPNPSTLNRIGQNCSTRLDQHGSRLREGVSCHCAIPRSVCCFFSVSPAFLSFTFFGRTYLADCTFQYLWCCSPILTCDAGDYLC
jgi:hypothetical protein